MWLYTRLHYAIPFVIHCIYFNWNWDLGKKSHFFPKEVTLLWCCKHGEARLTRTRSPPLVMCVNSGGRIRSEVSPFFHFANSGAERAAHMNLISTFERWRIQDFPLQWRWQSQAAVRPQLSACLCSPQTWAPVSTSVSHCTERDITGVLLKQNILEKLGCCSFFLSGWR